MSLYDAIENECLYRRRRVNHNVIVRGGRTKSRSGLLVLVGHATDAFKSQQALGRIESPRVEAGSSALFITARSCIGAGG